jgi:hypothetical protein
MASENAMQRDTTAAACLDAIAAISRVVVPSLTAKIFAVSATATESMWGNQQG